MGSAAEEDPIFKQKSLFHRSGLLRRFPGVAGGARPAKTSPGPWIRESGGGLVLTGGERRAAHSIIRARRRKGAGEKQRPVSKTLAFRASPLAPGPHAGWDCQWYLRGRASRTGPEADHPAGRYLEASEPESPSLALGFLQNELERQTDTPGKSLLSRSRTGNPPRWWCWACWRGRAGMGMGRQWTKQRPAPGGAGEVPAGSHVLSLPESTPIQNPQRLRTCLQLTSKSGG